MTVCQRRWGWTTKCWVVLKSMEWDNLFNYGEGNAINFEKLNGVVGIFGKNYSGKSSVVDSMLYTVYNSISKNNRKNLNIINQNKPSGCGRVEIDVAGKPTSLSGSREVHTKLHGEETEEAKTDVEFTYWPSHWWETSLNSLTAMEQTRQSAKSLEALTTSCLQVCPVKWGQWLSSTRVQPSVKKS